MKNKISIPFSFIFLVICIAEVIAVVTKSTLLEYIFKPLIIPSLYLLLFLSPNNVSNKYLLLLGLFFSWLGDVLLLLENKNQLYFIFGLVCFLTTHIFYIIYFLKIQSPKISFLKNYPALIFIVLAYAFTLVWFLFPHLGNLKIPVLIYAIIISVMLLCSIHVFLKVTQPANVFYLTGAIFFILSDSLLAINKFYHSFTAANILIISTYCAAQYFIVNGYIKQLPNE